MIWNQSGTVILDGIVRIVFDLFEHLFSIFDNVISTPMFREQHVLTFRCRPLPCNSGKLWEFEHFSTILFENRRSSKSFLIRCFISMPYITANDHQDCMTFQAVILSFTESVCSLKLHYPQRKLRWAS